MKDLKLDALRINAGLTQTEAAQLLGVCKSTLIKWEHYKAFPSSKQLVRLCQIYNCNMADVYIPTDNEGV